MGKNCVANRHIFVPSRLLAATVFVATLCMTRIKGIIETHIAWPVETELNPHRTVKKRRPFANDHRKRLICTIVLLLLFARMQQHRYSSSKASSAGEPATPAKRRVSQRSKPNEGVLRSRRMRGNVADQTRTKPPTERAWTEAAVRLGGGSETREAAGQRLEHMRQEENEICELKTDPEEMIEIEKPSQPSPYARGLRLRSL